MCQKHFACERVAANGRPGGAEERTARVCGAATPKRSEHVRAVRRQDPLFENPSP